MTGINPIGRGISKVVASVLGTASKTAPMRGLKNGFQKNAENALAWTMVGSIVVKDGIGCYKYVTQSLNNKEIPDKRRSFVTSVDLSNGILMIFTQLAMFVMMRKFSEPMFNKFFNKSFNPKAKRDMLTRLRMEATKLGEVAPRKIEAEKDFEAVRSMGLSLFKTIFDVGVATIIGKRILTPLVSTPIAKVVEDKVYPHLERWQKIKNGELDPEDKSEKVDEQENILEEDDD